MLDHAQYKDLEQDFQSCEPLKGRKDVYQFASNLADAFMGVVQYNLEMPGQSITELCEQMTVSPDSYANLKRLYKVSNKGALSQLVNGTLILQMCMTDW